jgi:choline dehydrogenase-like flavoprotein
LQASRGDSGTNQPTPSWFYEQARLLGGGSSINGICANRGSPYDYDEWEAKGAHGWGWSDGFCREFFAIMDHVCAHSENQLASE